MKCKPNTCHWNKFVCSLLLCLFCAGVLNKMNSLLGPIIVVGCSCNLWCVWALKRTGTAHLSHAISGLVGGWASYWTIGSGVNFTLNRPLTNICSASLHHEQTKKCRQKWQENLNPIQCTCISNQQRVFHSEKCRNKMTTCSIKHSNVKMKRI